MGHNQEKEAEKFGVPKTKTDLIDQIFEIWDNIEQEVVDTLVDSANTRINVVLNLNGKVSKY